jgi:hypothetical protein
MKRFISFLILLLIFLNIEAQNYITRNPDTRKDYVNVFYDVNYTLFDLWSDEPIFPNQDGVYTIYTASNEDRTPRLLIGKSSIIKENKSYKFKNYFNCKNWCEGKIFNSDLINVQPETIQPNIVNQPVSNESSINKDEKKKKSIFSSNANDGKFKVVRVKERNPDNNNAVLIDIYDKSLSLKVGDNVIITRADEVKIPGEKKTRISKTTIGKAKITEDYNKPLYTAKLIGNDGSKMKDYKDGDENYNAVKGEDNNIIVSKPSIMVIPKKIDPAKWVNSEYQLSKEEKMLIAAFKNKFEDNKFTTFGFESVLKIVLEKRQLNDNVQEDIKSKILEASGIDFFVEYENLDLNNTKCDKVFDFKIRNYSTGEDVASDIKSLYSCGTPDDYKNFASAILNAGAISKINSQFSSLLSNGRKISIVFNISNASQAKFSKEYNGTKLGIHINNCLQSLAFHGNLELESESDLRKDATVNIPILDESNGQKYQSTTFAEEILVYLKTYAGIECERVVSRQVITIKIK